jgi:hypothetical protein
MKRQRGWRLEVGGKERASSLQLLLAMQENTSVLEWSQYERRKIYL